MSRSRAKAAGAHFLSTDDHDQLVLSDDPDGPSRCNPVTAEDSCRDTRIEWHRPGGMDIPAESAAAYLERQRP